MFASPFSNELNGGSVPIYPLTPLSQILMRAKIEAGGAENENCITYNYCDRATRLPPKALLVFIFTKGKIGTLPYFPMN
jgi:hypothetical protein